MGLCIITPIKPGSGMQMSTSRPKDLRLQLQCEGNPLHCSLKDFPYDFNAYQISRQTPYLLCLVVIFVRRLQHVCVLTTKECKT
jgi:hypothetical protein